jgi:hypothetical protein
LYWSFSRGSVFTRQEAIQSVVVVEQTWFFDGDRLETIRQRDVLRVAIADDTTDALARPQGAADDSDHGAGTGGSRPR